MAKEKKEEGKAKGEIAPWRPLSGLSRMEREMERMFGDFLGRPWFGERLPERLRLLGDWGLKMPAIEIYEEKDDVVVKAELPGMEKEDIDLNISGNILTLRGEKKKQEAREEKGYYYSERSFGRIERSIEIPGEVQAEKVHARFKDGILEVRLPKTEEAKRKEIRVHVE